MLSPASISVSAIFIILIGCNDAGTLGSPAKEHRRPSAAFPNEPPGESRGIDENWKNTKDTSITAVLTNPPSRAYNCFRKANYDCDLFGSENLAGAIVNDVDFLSTAASDGRIASAGDPSLHVLDLPSPGRWNPSQLKIREHNATHFATEIDWTFNKENVVIDRVQVFLSNGDYTADRSIERSMLRLTCLHENGRHEELKDRSLRFDCYIGFELLEALLYDARGFGVLLSTLKLAGEDYAFYQLADVSINEPGRHIANFHGFILDPPSRAKLCQMRVNHNCGQVTYEPQSVEGFKGFPDRPHSPPDGAIASGNNRAFAELNEYGADRWARVEFPDVSCHNETHVAFNITWLFTATHSTQSIHVYLSNKDYTAAEPLSRRHLDLDPLCTTEFQGRHPPRQLTIVCPISFRKYRELSTFRESLLLSVWNVRDTSFAFYQVVDFKPLSAAQSYENVSRKCK